MPSVKFPAPFNNFLANCLLSVSLNGIKKLKLKRNYLYHMMRREKNNLLLHIASLKSGIKIVRFFVENKCGVCTRVTDDVFLDCID